jgi:hypothetical protein
MATPAEDRSREVARPLRVLVPLIKEAISRGARASVEHYRRAGAMLLEAKAQVPYGQWQAWLDDNFALSIKTAQAWMKLAREFALETRNPRFSTLSDVAYPHKKGAVRPPDWHAGVSEARDRVDADRLAQARQDEHRERRLMRALGLQLIDIGYKVLATKLHPDKGGSKEAMVRLNRVRDELKAAL